MEGQGWGELKAIEGMAPPGLQDHPWSLGSFLRASDRELEGSLEIHYLAQEPPFSEGETETQRNSGEITPTRVKRLTGIRTQGSAHEF